MNTKTNNSPSYIFWQQFVNVSGLLKLLLNILLSLYPYLKEIKSLEFRGDKIYVFGIQSMKEYLVN